MRKRHRQTNRHRDSWIDRKSEKTDGEGERQTDCETDKER